MMWDREDRSRSRTREVQIPSPRVPFPQPFAPLGLPEGSMHSSYTYYPVETYGRSLESRLPTPYAYPNTPLPQDPSRMRPRAHSSSTTLNNGSHHEQHHYKHDRHGHQHHHHSHSHSHNHEQNHNHSRSRSRTRTISFNQVPQVTLQAPTPDPTRGIRMSQTSTHNLPHKHSFFQYSKCNGRKKALCIGINYRGSSRELKGCINDAKNVRRFLMRNYGYKEGDIVLLVDDSQNPRQLPTRKNIIDAMRWLVSDAHAHDALFFHYSGHGGQTPDLDGDEADGYDEVIFPLDYKKRGHIVDDEMNQIMVQPLPTGCRLTAVFDSCHSGTVLDLPYIYHSDGRLNKHASGSMTAAVRAKKGTKADVISFSGCRDDGTSADTFSGGEAVGAMSNAFISSLKQNSNQSYRDLLRSVREILRKNYSQKPQLSSSHSINTNLKFII